MTEDQVNKLIKNSKPPSKIKRFWRRLNLWTKSNQEQEDFAASKLKSAVHAFLDKNGKVGQFWSICSQSRYTHLEYLLLQQEGDDANSLVIEKDNITGEIVSQVEKSS